MPDANIPSTYQELVLRLQEFWAKRGCVLQQPYDTEVGAGTMAPETFLRVLGPKPYKVAYVQPSRRPADGRYGDNPNRLYKHMQLQVILKPPPENVQELYLDSLAAIGIDLRKHDIKFEEDNWEAPTLAAWGVGWQVMLDGLEITQFTYFQQCGGIDLDPICAELTYGLERIAAFLQDVDSIYDIVWARDPETGREVTYRDVRYREEYEFSVFNFELADTESLSNSFNTYAYECRTLIEFTFGYVVNDRVVNWNWEDFIVQTRQGYIRISSEMEGVETMLLPGEEFADFQPAYNPGPGRIEFLREPELKEEHIRLTYSPMRVMLSRAGVANPVSLFALPMPAFDLCLKCSHIFNLLDARGAISVTERVGMITRVRNLAVKVAEAYLQTQAIEQLARAGEVG
jgi:glycyl-tRNA synthetase alpha chain